jgi:hypothetical protein
VLPSLRRERGRAAIEEEDRVEVYEFFRWYRRGIGR